MTEISQTNPGPDPNLNLEQLLQSLRRKEGTWVDWGKACQKLQKAGYSPQQIFEATGFEPTQQNQVIVGAQVYTTLVNNNAPKHVLDYFERKGSDILYEFRVLDQAVRVAAAELILKKKLDVDEVHEVTKAIKEFSYLKHLPDGFSAHPGDAVAYQCWKFTREQEDLQARSRFIARGLNFAHSESARQKIEKLLTDFTVTKARPVPTIPIYRLESEEELPRVLPVVGKLPLTQTDLRAVPLIEESGPFRLVKFSGEGAWVPIPGWQVVLEAEDPVALLAGSDRLPTPQPGKSEEVLIVIDRAQRQWNMDSYFVVESAGQLEIQWFAETPSLPLLGRVLLILRPKKILDESVTKDLWQIDE